MAGKDLQQLATSVDYIDHDRSLRRALPARRHHITQKVRIAGQRTLYISVHDDARAEACPGRRAGGQPTMISGNQGYRWRIVQQAVKRLR